MDTDWCLSCGTHIVSFYPLHFEITFIFIPMLYRMVQHHIVHQNALTVTGQYPRPLHLFTFALTRPLFILFLTPTTMSTYHITTFTTFPTKNNGISATVRASKHGLPTFLTATQMGLRPLKFLESRQEQIPHNPRAHQNYYFASDSP